MYSIFRSLLSGFITKTIGLHFRYFFFKLIGRKKTINYLSGKTKDGPNNVLQVIFNFCIGSIIFALFSIAFFYIYFQYVN